MTVRVDLAIVGSGFSGSLLAMIARRLGRSVALLERGHHPRFAIGESSTPLAALLLEEIAHRYALPQLMPFTKYGTWKRSRPDVGCGLKRGFSFFRHEAGLRFASDSSHANQLLVAASPNDEIGDVHWYRPDFDHCLVNEAVALGAYYMDGAHIEDVSLRERNRSTRPLADAPSGAGEPGPTVLRGERRRAGGRTERFEIAAGLVVDATGPRGFLHRHLEMKPRALPGMGRTQALYTHFSGVRPFASVAADAFGGAPPYPVDAAAVHHVVDGGWIWVLRFDNGITSAGVAATDALAADLRLGDGADAWGRLLRRYPSIEAQFADAAPTRAFTWLSELSFAAESITGDGWVMLPSAAGIVDPLLSTGFPLTLLGVQRVAAAIADHWGTGRLAPALARYADLTRHELDTTARLVGVLYDSFGDWEQFTALAQLYFAAASYAESARRLGKPEVAGEAFLLGDHPTFAAGLARCLTLAGDSRRTPQGRAALLAAVHETIAPVNVAGLGDARRCNWYPCTADDLVAASGKLGASPAEVAVMLERCGFTPRPVVA